LISALLLMPVAASAQEKPAETKDLQKVSVALDWMLNTNHVGIIVARDKGFYAENGLDVEVLPYSDTSSAALLASGVTEFGYVATLALPSDRALLPHLTALWDTMLHESGRRVYYSDTEAITRPADPSRKTYDGFGSNWEKALISRMSCTDGGESVWDTVTLN